jgi:hypothetical protein
MGKNLKLDESSFENTLVKCLDSGWEGPSARPMMLRNFFLIASAYQFSLFVVSDRS